MATAYNPGLTVTGNTLFRKERRLPMKGEVLVKKGDKVKSDQVVAQTFLPGHVHLINAANRLGVSQTDVKDCMLKKVGDSIEKGEVIASSSSFFGLFSAKLESPITGTVETVSEVTGQVILREAPIPVKIKGYIDGEVVEVIEKEGAVLETAAAFIQGIFGIGGETVAPLKMAVDSYDKILDGDAISSEFADKIIVGGSLVTSDAIYKALDHKVKGIIVGGIHDKDLKDFLGYDLGVAITGSESKGITLIITEGFGPINMAEKTFDLLKENEGNKTSINGATQIRAGVIRPEIVISKADVAKDEVKPTASSGLGSGTSVRIIREPHFGRVAKVASLPHELQKVDSEAMVRVVEVEFDDGEKYILPRANIEIIEG